MVLSFIIPMCNNGYKIDYEFLSLQSDLADDQEHSSPTTTFVNTTRARLPDDDVSLRSSSDECQIQNDMEFCCDEEQLHHNENNFHENGQNHHPFQTEDSTDDIVEDVLVHQLDPTEGQSSEINPSVNTKIPFARLNRDRYVASGRLTKEIVKEEFQ